VSYILLLCEPSLRVCIVACSKESFYVLYLFEVHTPLYWAVQPFATQLLSADRCSQMCLPFWIIGFNTLKSSKQTDSPLQTINQKHQRLAKSQFLLHFFRTIFRGWARVSVHIFGGFKKGASLVHFYSCCLLGEVTDLKKSRGGKGDQIVIGIVGRFHFNQSGCSN